MKRNGQTEQSMREKNIQIYELDGMLFLPHTLSQWTREKILQSSNAPIREADTWTLIRKEPQNAVFYRLDDSGHLGSIVVYPNRYKSSFLGLNSGQPKIELCGVGYEIALETDAWTYLSLGGMDNHYIILVWEHGELDEVRYHAESLAEHVGLFAWLPDSRNLDRQTRREIGNIVLALVNIGNRFNSSSKRQETEVFARKLDKIGGFSLKKSVMRMLESLK